MWDNGVFSRWELWNNVHIHEILSTFYVFKNIYPIYSTFKVVFNTLNFPSLLYFVLWNFKQEPIFWHRTFSTETLVTLPREQACSILNYKKIACEWWESRVRWKPLVGSCSTLRYCPWAVYQKLIVDNHNDLFMHFLTTRRNGQVATDDCNGLVFF